MWPAEVVTCPPRRDRATSLGRREDESEGYGTWISRVCEKTSAETRAAREPTAAAHVHRSRKSGSLSPSTPLPGIRCRQVATNGCGALRAPRISPSFSRKRNRWVGRSVFVTGVSLFPRLHLVNDKLLHEFLDGDNGPGSGMAAAPGGAYGQHA